MRAFAIYSAGMSNIPFSNQSLILLAPCHAFRRLCNNDTTSFESSLQLRFPFFHVILLGARFLQNDSSRCSIFLRIVKFSLNTCEVVVVMVDPLWGRKIFLLDVHCGIAEAVALCPLLMALNAGKRACESGAARTAVFVGPDMA